MDLQSLDLRLLYDPSVLEVDARPATPGVQIASGDVFTSFTELLNEVDSALGRIDYSVAADARRPIAGRPPWRWWRSRGSHRGAAR